MQVRCPEHGLLSLRCAHAELAHPTLGFLLMVVAAVHLVIGVYYLAS